MVTTTMTAVLQLGNILKRVINRLDDQQGIKDAVKTIQPLKPVRVLIESTGRLELEFICAAHQAGLPIVVCNPSHVRHFAKSSGRLAKTNKRNAQVIAHFGEAMKPMACFNKTREVKRHQCFAYHTIAMS
jgi:transposase